MPTVSLYGDRKVAPTPLPGARLTAAETPESLGAGLDLATARKDEAIGGLGGQVAGIGGALYAQHEQQARDQADLAVELQSTSDLTAHTTQLSIDALNLKGQEASGPAADRLRDDFNVQADAISATLRTDRQRTTFAQTRARAFDTFNTLQLRHADKESQTFTAQASDALIGNKGDEAVLHVDNPAVAIAAIADQMTAIRASGASLGQSAEVIKARLAETTTKTAHDLIMRAIENDNVAGAQAYFDHLGPGTPATADKPAEPGLNLIAGETLGKIEAALSAGKLKGESQEKADEIIAAGGSLSDQLDKAKGLTPDVRQLVEQRVEHANGLKAATDRATAETTLKGAYDILDHTGGNYSRIPATLIATLPGSERAALQSYGAHLAAGHKAETDWATYYALMTAASSTPQDFTNYNLLSSRAKLGDGEFKQLVELQSSIRKGNLTKADKDLAGFRTKDEILTDTLAQYGISAKRTTAAASTPAGIAQGQRVAELRRLLDQQVDTMEHQTGKKPSNVDIQKTLDTILSTSVTMPGSYWGLVPFTSTKFSDTTKPLIDMTIDGVPAGEKPVIVESLRRAGRPVSDATILDLYMQGELYRSTLGRPAAATDTAMAAQVAELVVNKTDRVAAYVPIAKIPAPVIAEYLNFTRRVSPALQQIPDADLQPQVADRIQRAYALRLLGGTRADVESALMGREAASAPPAGTTPAAGPGDAGGSTLRLPTISMSVARELADVALNAFDDPSAQRKFVLLGARLAQMEGQGVLRVVKEAPRVQMENLKYMWDEFVQRKREVVAGTNAAFAVGGVLVQKASELTPKDLADWADFLNNVPEQFEPGSLVNLGKFGGELAGVAARNYVVKKRGS